MKVKDLERARKEFDGRYAIDYPMPTQAEAHDVQTGGALIWVWGIVAIAGAIISLPHTLGVVISTFKADTWVQFVVGIAVFFGVELALIGVAYTEAFNALETGKKPAPLTARSALRIIAFRLGLVNTLPTPQTDNGGRSSNGGLLLILFCSALLFNQADASRNAELLNIAKYVAGGIAPVLLLLAGHEFAHALASRVLAKKIADRRHLELIAEWEAKRDEAWRRYVATITAPITTPVGNEGDVHHHATNGMTNGKSNGADFLANGDGHTPITNGHGHYANGNGTVNS